MLSLCKRWQLSKQINKASTHFYMRRNTHSGALTKTQHQTPVKHTSTEANRFQILFQSFPQLWTLVFCFPLFLIPPFPLLSVLFLCCFCVYLFIYFCSFFFPFFFFLNWPIVMPLMPPVWCRFGSMCLWTDSLLWKWCICPALWSEHGKMEMSL